MVQSSGTLLYRRQAVGTGALPALEVLLVHPSGNYNRHKPWGIPKGLPDDGESLEEAARRETVEEAGVVPGELTPLGSITYRKSRKVIHCFAGACAGGCGRKMRLVGNRRLRIPSAG